MPNAYGYTPGDWCDESLFGATGHEGWYIAQDKIERNLSTLSKTDQFQMYMREMVAQVPPISIVTHSMRYVEYVHISSFEIYTPYLLIIFSMLMRLLHAAYISICQCFKARQHIYLYTHKTHFVAKPNHNKLCVVVPAECEQDAEDTPSPVSSTQNEYETEDESDSESETDSDYPDTVNAMFGMYEDEEDETEPVKNVNELFGMFKGYDSDSEPDEEDEEDQEISKPISEQIQDLLHEIKSTIKHKTCQMYSTCIVYPVQQSYACLVDFTKKSKSLLITMKRWCVDKILVPSHQLLMATIANPIHCFVSNIVAQSYACLVDFTKKSKSLLNTMKRWCVDKILVPSHQLFMATIANPIHRFVSNIVAVFCIIYIYVRQRVRPGYTLHFVGLCRPDTFSESRYDLLRNINTEHTLITVITSLQATDTVLDLKSVIRKTYNIADEHELLIVFSHHIVSDNQAQLGSVGVLNNSLLTLAICRDAKQIVTPPQEPEPVREPTPTPIPPPVVEDESESESDSEYPNEVNSLFAMYEDYESDAEPVQDANELFGMFKHYESDSEDEEEPEEEKVAEPTPPPPTWPRPGFDVITQEEGVLVHKMPKCGHEMNKDSLYHYALSTFSDASNLHIKCPHSHERNANGLCHTRWEYNTITDILTYPEEENTSMSEEWINYAKLELLAARNVIQNKTSMSEEWINYAKLELLAARNVIQNKLDVQKCPRCQCLYYKNYDENSKGLEDIKTLQDIEDEFKFQCIFCVPGSQRIIERVPVPKPPKEEKPAGVHDEDDIEEDIDGDEVNALFGMQPDDDEDDDDEVEEDENQEALKAILHMFDGDEPDFIEEEREKSLNGFCWCCGDEWVEQHVCDSTFKEDLVKILTEADTKAIGSVDGVPSIRCCPKCCQLIYHSEACKHMRCQSCHTDFCFVCLKPQLNGAWQCGSHSSVCPVAPRQDMHTLPDTIVITKKTFQLY
eukprot:CAMPEP_0197072294 /NCGR_PEP_ID=MMETSP1384-20130603/210021_1 /TAXON_ID=29189 /ORGANISM="Ammonia sp." /LENGTH=962 /DNA_ID=CAMNT_0042511111 /DNA_START=90 /DNA_END=2978 /DNA_ORIENTATION=-